MWFKAAALLFLLTPIFSCNFKWASQQSIWTMFAATGAVEKGAVVVVIFNLCHYGLLLAISTAFHSKLCVDTGLIVAVHFFVRTLCPNCVGLIYLVDAILGEAFVSRHIVIICWSLFVFLMPSTSRISFSLASKWTLNRPIWRTLLAI